MTASSEQSRKPGRPRSSETHQAILDATLALLAEVGFQALSIEQVAARAGAGKMTIYRRWPSKEALVTDAIRSIQADMPVIDSGNLRADLILMYGTALRGLQSNPLIKPLYLRLFSEWSTGSDVFQVFLSQLILPRFQQFTQMVEHAQERGEIRRDIPLDIVIDLLVGPMLFRWLAVNTLHQSSTTPDFDAFTEQIADLVIRCLA
jgi:AcrR family transcriptional regulator